MYNKVLECLAYLYLIVDGRKTIFDDKLYRKLKKKYPAEEIREVLIELKERKNESRRKK